jgi:Domain of Unknown Function (DUF928)
MSKMSRTIISLSIQSFLVLSSLIVIFGLQMLTVHFSGYAKADDEDADLGRPATRSSGQGRNPCPDELIALVPGDGNIVASQECGIPSNSTLAETSVADPTFWIYVPPTRIKKAEFVLIDNKQGIATYNCRLPEKPGIVGFHLEKYKIIPGNVYRWQFSVIKKISRPTENTAVQGKIKLTSSMNSYWYDDVNSIAESRLRNEQINMSDKWHRLLGSAGLQEMSSLPIVGYCVPK